MQRDLFTNNKDLILYNSRTQKFVADQIQQKKKKKKKNRSCWLGEGVILFSIQDTTQGEGPWYG